MTLRGGWANVRNHKYDGARVVTRTVLFGSLGVAVLLTLLLVGYDTLVANHLRIRTVIGFGVILYLLAALLLTQRQHATTARWMIILLYEALVFSVLLYWGLNAAAGLLAVCFVIILPGVLIGAKYIFPVTLSSIFVLTVVQTIHALHIFQPDRTALSTESTYWDVFTYSTMLVIFALVSWLSQNQTEQALQRALKAEAILRRQKAAVTAELKQESATLRQTRLKHSRQLYYFALLGQSSAATLHELSNQLSILNLDIADLSQQNKNSAAIGNASETIAQINTTVRQARRQLHSCAVSERFLAADIITKCIDDIAPKFTQRNVPLTKELNMPTNTGTVTGSPTALMQIVTILLNNALDACQDLENPWVRVRLESAENNLQLSVVDSGSGIDEAMRTILFKPKTSTKPTGLGVGLYLAKHLTRTQLGGTIHLEPASEDRGAHFIVTIPQAAPSLKRRIGIHEAEK